MTQFIEPNMKSDLVAPRVHDWLQAFRTGLLEEFAVSKGGSGWLINLASGKVSIRGTVIHDDLSRIDSTILDSIMPATTGSDTHVIIYCTYTYQDVFPPAGMTFHAAKETGSPPSSPAIPADSVKLADIFIDDNETDLSNALIIKTPPMPARGNADGDVLMEKLVNGNLNVIFSGGGSMVYSGGELSWSQDMLFFSPVVTHKEKFMSVPLAAGQVLLATSPLAGVTDNCIIFTVFNRTAPTEPLATPASLTLQVLDLTTPDPAAFAAFNDPDTRERVVFVASVIDGVLHTRSGMGASLPSPDADGNTFLRNDPGGNHYWSLIYEDLITAILSISSFSNTSPQIVELGTIVNSPTFAATVANDDTNGPTTATLDPGAQNVVPDFGGGSTAAAIVSNQTGLQELTPGNNASQTFTLTADDGATPAVSTADILWRRYGYWGFEAADPGVGNYTLAWLQALTDPQQALRSGKSGSVGGTPSGSQYLFFAWPAWMGKITSAFQGAVDVLTSIRPVAAPANSPFLASTPDHQVDIDTESAPTIEEDYYVYRTDALQGGPITLTVG